IEQDGPTREMPVTGYTLALSWSPEYCRTRADSSSDAMQCSGRNGRFGMVLHGLWPEGGNGRWPQWCQASRAPDLALIRRDLCISPSARLMAWQWAKHGSCAFRRPETYFNISRILWNSLRFPDFDRLSRREDLDAGIVREAFATANRHFEPEFVGVKLNRRGWLEELRICYGTNFFPAKCSASQFGPKDSAEVKIWRGL
ncbi:MAG TPA: ribonuclease T, partial [Sphingomonadaceae bacterium]|nr:ribonuclease T [Sphingomonadaceae bacterium]